MTRDDLLYMVTAAVAAGISLNRNGGFIGSRHAMVDVRMSEEGSGGLCIHVTVVAMAMTVRSDDAM